MGTFKTTATRGWRREGCKGASAFEEEEGAIVGVVVEFEVAGAGGCRGIGRWPLEEP